MSDEWRYEDDHEAWEQWWDGHGHVARDLPPPAPVECRPRVRDLVVAFFYRLLERVPW